MFGDRGGFLFSTLTSIQINKFNVIDILEDLWGHEVLQTSWSKDSSATLRTAFAAFTDKMWKGNTQAIILISVLQDSWCLQWGSDHTKGTHKTKWQTSGLSRGMTHFHWNRVLFRFNKTIRAPLKSFFFWELLQTMKALLQSQLFHISVLSAFTPVSIYCLLQTATEQLQRFEITDNMLLLFFRCFRWQWRQPVWRGGRLKNRHL